MERSDDTLPFRHATRLVNAFQRDVGLAGMTVVGRDLDGIAVLLMLLRQALACGERPVSVHAVALSLQRPPETIRRTAARLAAQGFLEKRPRAFRLPQDFRALPAIMRLEEEVRAILAGLLTQFEQAGFALPDGIHDQPDPLPAIAALDIYLSVFELAEAHVRQPMLLHVVGAVTVLNAAALTADPQLGLLYGHDRTVPPDHLRRPAGVKEIAEATGFPYPTVWRHVVAAERSGALRLVPGGYLLGDRLIDDAEVSRRSRIKIKYVRRVLNDLARGGGAVRPG